MDPNVPSLRIRRDEIRPTDVCLGRGRGAFNLEGNAKYRNTIWDYKDEYQGSKHHETKAIICAEVIRFIADSKPPGRFLEPLSSDDDDGTVYVLVHPDRVDQKVRQSLREKRFVPPKGYVSKRDREKQQQQTKRKRTKRCKPRGTEKDVEHGAAPKKKQRRLSNKTGTEQSLSTSKTRVCQRPECDRVGEATDVRKPAPPPTQLIRVAAEGTTYGPRPTAPSTLVAQHASCQQRTEGDRLGGEAADARKPPPKPLHHVTDTTPYGHRPTAAYAAAEVERDHPTAPQQLTYYQQQHGDRMNHDQRVVEPTLAQAASVETVVKKTQKPAAECTHMDWATFIPEAGEQTFLGNPHQKIKRDDTLPIPLAMATWPSIPKPPPVEQPCHTGVLWRSLPPHMSQFLRLIRGDDLIENNVLWTQHPQNSTSKDTKP